MLRSKRPSPYRAALRSSGFNPYRFLECLALDVSCDGLATLAREQRDVEIMQYDFSTMSVVEDRYLLEEIISKFPYQNTIVDKKAVAVRSFFDEERRLRGINSVLFDQGGLSPTARERLFYSRGKIWRTLRMFTWDDVVENMEFPKRGTVCTPRKVSDRRLKVLRNKHSITSRLSQTQAFVDACEGTEWASVLTNTFYWDCAALDTVPKKASTDRTIGKEPLVNAAVQRGIGLILQRELLLRCGVNLRDQTVNQKLAYEGSVGGKLATIDLKNASSSICAGLVYDLVPPWLFELLWACRTDSVSYGGVVTFLEQFSGMGCGFTFELESLIFWALCHGIAASLGITLNSCNFGIYGDDIICPVELVPHVKDTFAELGLVFNEKKSHSSGAFRESCGCSYLSGRNITPFYIRDEFDHRGRTVRSWSFQRLSRLWYQFHDYISRMYPGYPVRDTAEFVLPNSYAYLTRLALESELDWATGPGEDGGFWWTDRVYERTRKPKRVAVFYKTETLEGPFLLRTWQLTGRTSYSIEAFPSQEGLRWCAIPGTY